jgi:putative transposase
VRFAFFDSWRHVWRVETIWRVMRVGLRGYRSWRSRGDMKVLAHNREQYSLNDRPVGSRKGRPRMIMELKEAGLDVGQRRVGRLMKINGIRPVRTRKHKVTTNSNPHSSWSLGVAPNILERDFCQPPLM